MWPSSLSMRPCRERDVRIVQSLSQRRRGRPDGRFRPLLKDDPGASAVLSALAHNRSRERSSGERLAHARADRHRRDNHRLCSRREASPADGRQPWKSLARSMRTRAFPSRRKWILTLRKPQVSRTEVLAREQGVGRSGRRWLAHRSGDSEAAGCLLSLTSATPGHLQGAGQGRQISAAPNTHDADHRRRPYRRFAPAAAACHSLTPR
jgi:hypothetical protein